MPHFHVAQIIPLTQGCAKLAQNRVGRGRVEIKIGLRETLEKVIRGERDLRFPQAKTVSYTHLTLPTKA